MVVAYCRLCCRGRLSLVAISFYALSLLFGPCGLSEFTLAGPQETQQFDPCKVIKPFNFNTWASSAEPLQLRSLASMVSSLTLPKLHFVGSSNCPFEQKVVSMIIVEDIIYDSSEKWSYVTWFKAKYLVRHVVLVLSHTLAAICPELQPLPYLIHMLHTDPEDPWKAFYKKKLHFVLSVKVFNTKVLIGDNIFTSPTGDGTTILRGHLSQAKF